MEKYQEARDKAIKYIKTADHMLSVTYPVVKDTKLLVAVMDNIFLSLTSSMAAILYFDRLFKQIPPFHNTFESKLNMFKEKSMHLHGLDESFIRLMMDIKEIIVQHKESPMEFSRNDKFVICNKDYKMRTLTTVQMKEYIAKTKVFVSKMNEVVNKYEGIFKRR
ncbi:hypothetical protein KY330_01075 [Candidatus Woesearchaeota archaeon]|nr:hypothetical protein [Candidatus Woesearchaeota archaeon]